MAARGRFGWCGMDFGPLQARRCSHCGGRLGSTYYASALGTPFCSRHRELPRCRICAAPARSAGKSLCSACSTEAIRSARDVARELPAIRHDMHAIQIRLDIPVRVHLVDCSDLATAHAGRGVVIGRTTHIGGRVLRIEIARGLVQREFGITVVHEAMHAWLVQNHYPRMLTSVTEGLCQAMSYRYLRRHASEPRARILARGIRESPDPVYGDGFRAVRASALQHGMDYVLEYVRQTGQLP